jgi:hypothetical protein
MRGTDLITAAVLLCSLAACGSVDGESRTTSAPVSAAPTSTTTATITTTPPVTESSSPESGIVHTWVGAPVDLTELPIGTSLVSTTEPAVGGLYACNAGNPNGGGAFEAGPWIDEAAGTWDATAKLAVEGSVSWPMARYAESVDGATRTITSSGLPVGEVTGTFPIAATDPAYSYDRNPNSISENDVSYSLPTTPVEAATPGCLPPAAVAIMRNGVVAFAPLDELNRDAVAYETQDECDGHPQQTGVYHYHDVPSCIVAASEGPSTVVGFATDGYPIVVERNAAGELPTNADLDECHGRTSPVILDGTVVDTYHYSATHEFPYFIGCFHGTTTG